MHPLLVVGPTHPDHGEGHGEQGVQDLQYNRQYVIVRNTVRDEVAVRSVEGVRCGCVSRLQTGLGFRFMDPKP